MIDTTTRQRLVVSTDGGAGRYIMAPVDQLDPVTTLLDANGIAYSVDEEVLSLDGKPEFGFVNLARRTDPATVQRLLDGVP